MITIFIQIPPASKFASTSNTRIEDVKSTNSSFDNTNDLGWKLSTDNSSGKSKKQKVAQNGEIGDGEDREDVKVCGYGFSLVNNDSS